MPGTNHIEAGMYWRSVPRSTKTRLHAKNLAKAGEAHRKGKSRLRPRGSRMDLTSSGMFMRSNKLYFIFPLQSL